jgi:ABC-2 type transport system ATP-binding protein
LTPAVSARGLTKRFRPDHGWRSLLRASDEKVALDGIDLDVRPGEVFGLLGPNGAGKTTLIKILCTLLLPSEGRASVSGLDVVDQSPAVRRKLGLVYGDERTFSWRLSVRENLRFYAGLYGLRRNTLERRISELLDMVGLDVDEGIPMHHFSSGMKQRAAIARGLLNDPDVLLMDEPTRSLDPVAAADLRELIRRRVADGRRTVLLATHLIHEAEAVCDRVAVLNHGRLELVGSVAELRQALRTEDVHRIVVAGLNGNILEQVKQVAGVLSVRTEHLEDSTQVLELSVEPDSAALPHVIRALVESGGDIWSSTRRELSLEEIFHMALKADVEGVAQP